MSAFEEADEALTGGWIAFRDGEPPLDPCALAMQWPVLVRFSSRFAHAGFFGEDGEMWSSDGRLLAQSRQLGLMT